MNVTPDLTIRRSEQIAKLAGALAKAQGAFGKLNKSKTATIPGKDGKQGYSYTYSDLADVLECVRKPLSDNEIAFMQLISGGNRRLTTTLIHSSGEWIASDYELAPCQTPQQFGSQLTYARRYSAQPLLGLSGEEDDDGAAAEQGARAAPRQRQERAAPRQRQERAALAGPAGPKVAPKGEKKDPTPPNEHGVTQAMIAGLFGAAKPNGWTKDNVYVLRNNIGIRSLTEINKDQLRFMTQTVSSKRPEEVLTAEELLLTPTVLAPVSPEFLAASEEHGPIGGSTTAGSPAGGGA